MATYRINIEDRLYETFDICETLTKIPAKDLNIDPAKSKLFNQDIFKFDKKGDHIILLHSAVRSMSYIPGILVIGGDQTFGKTKKGRSLYKCIPDDRRLPIFLVPYNLHLNFNKKIFNKYVVFKVRHWNEKHPRGELANVLGDVSILDNFYEYQLYCKSLHASIQAFTKETMKVLKSKSEKYFIDNIIKKYNIEDRRNLNIITIDPKGSKDFDDAFSLQSCTKTRLLLSIYISNVSLWLDAMGIWDSFSQRIATIYLPDRKRPMLPTILSDALCSLQEKRTRFAFTLDVYINAATYEIEEISYKNTVIIVKHNLRYDTEKMKKNKLYIKTFKLITNMNERYKYMENIRSSHDVIAYIMILMNYLSAKEMVKHKIGIFRSVKGNKNFTLPKNIPKDIVKFLKMWNSFGGTYVKFQNLESHDILAFDAYIHITSPIRRLIDLLNIIEFQSSCGLFAFNESSRQFYNKWTEKTAFEYINKTMRSIRKVQNDCNLLKICSTDKGILNEIYDGFIFDKMVRGDSLIQYMVYIPKLKMVNRFTSRHEKVNLTKQRFKLFVFIDENRLKQKIRIELVD